MRRLRPGWLLLSTALAACANLPPHHAVRRPVVLSPTMVVEPHVPTPASVQVESSDQGLWEPLRASFAMADCNTSSSALAWARRYARDPARFADNLRTAMPAMRYVLEVARREGVPGEFVLLPWIESQYQSLAGRRGSPAGIWQIMPATAASLGLRIDRDYDGRLDIAAASDAVMRLLKQYHQQFGDWRVVDYAFNAGEFTMRKLVAKEGMPSPEPVIPYWPVRHVTREHLAKLLAMACIVRAPDRFGVQLPTFSEDQQLVQVKIDRSMPMADAAKMASMPLPVLKHFNAAFRGGTVDAATAPYLLLPAVNARKLADAIGQSDGRRAGSESPARPTTDGQGSPAAAGPQTVRHTPPAMHTVRSGESLWSIARRYSVSVAQLQRWNHLGSKVLKPGMSLQVGESR